jgi:FlaA1/EpsC-like NDP-sugar epimerase
MKNRLMRDFRRKSLAFFDFFLLYCCALFTSYAVNGNLVLIYKNPKFTILAIALQIVFLLFFRIYDIRLIDSSLDLVFRGAGSLFLSNIGLAVGMLLLIKDIPLSLRLVTVYLPLNILVILGYRVIYRIMFSYHIKGDDEGVLPRTVVYGAGEIGLQLSRQHFKKKLPYNLLGFVDDDQTKWHSIVGGLTVLGGLDNLSSILRAKEAEVLIIAITDLSSEKMKQALDTAKRIGLETKIVPSLFELEDERKSAIDLRSINVEDLLGRSSVTFDKTPVEKMVKGKTILVTGAGGSIGSEICRQLLTYEPAKLLLLDNDETELHDLSLRLHKYQAEFSDLIMPIVCDVTNKAKIEAIFAKYEIDILFHAAAYKHVPMMEYYPEEAIKTNIGGTYTILNAAVKFGISRCILISTDKAVNPTNVMGATKRVAEMIASMLSTEKTKIVCVRFGNVLGSRGSMLPLFVEQMQAGLPITVTDRKIIRYFMTISEAVSLVFLAGAIGNSAEVMVLDMGEQVNVYDFAKRLVKYFGDGRSEVVVTGLRPGEKLYEEKLSDKDKTIPTDSPKVFKAIVNNSLELDKFKRFLESIESSSNGELVEVLQTLVPEFTYKGPPT